MFLALQIAFFSSIRIVFVSGRPVSPRNSSFSISSALVNKAISSRSFGLVLSCKVQRDPSKVADGFTGQQVDFTTKCKVKTGIAKRLSHEEFVVRVCYVADKG